MFLDLTSDLLQPGPRNLNFKAPFRWLMSRKVWYLWLCRQTLVCSMDLYFLFPEFLGSQGSSKKGEHGKSPNRAKEHSKVFRWEQRTELSHLELVPLFYGYVSQNDLRGGKHPGVSTFFLFTSPLSLWNSVENVYSLESVLCPFPPLFFPFS